MNVKLENYEDFILPIILCKILYYFKTTDLEMLHNQTKVKGNMFLSDWGSIILFSLLHKINSKKDRIDKYWLN